MSAESSQADLFARVDFPTYSMTMGGNLEKNALISRFIFVQISPRHILVAGGGGAAKTGVKNGFEIFEITNNGEQLVGESITKYSIFIYSLLL